MNEQQANQLAKALNNIMPGWSINQSGGGIHLVEKEFENERLVVIGDECICEYPSEMAFDAGIAEHTIVTC